MTRKAYKPLWEKAVVKLKKMTKRNTTLNYQVTDFTNTIYRQERTISYWRDQAEYYKRKYRENDFIKTKEESQK